MNLEFLERTVFGASLTRWLLAAALAGTAYLVLIVLRRSMERRIGTWAARTATTWDDLIVELIARIRWYFLLVVAGAVGLRLTPLSETVTAWERAALAVVSLLQAGVWANGIITFLAERYIRMKTSGDLGARATVFAIGYAARLAVWTLLVITGLDFFGVKITALLAGLGIGGLAVALAAQNVLSDLFSALAIVLDRPFVIGDFVIFDGYMGTVEHVGLKTTRIRSLSGEQIVIANSDLLKSRIRNYKRMEERRIVFTLDVTYNTPPDVVAKIPAMVREVIESQKDTRFDRSHFMSYAASSLQVETVYFVLSPDYNKYADTQHAINLEILKRFNAAGIQFAFPTRTIVMADESSPPPPPATKSKRKSS